MAQLTTGSTPYGYRIQRTAELAPVPEEQAVIFLVVHLRRRGLSLQGVASELNRLGLVTRNGIPFSKQTVSLILGREAGGTSLADTG